MPAVIQPSFARGEIGPPLYGRVDTAAYLVALRAAYNCVIHAYGGVSNRPGLEFVGPQKEHGYTARLVPFRFKTTDTYMLEFGDLYMRVIRNDSHVVDTSETATISDITQANPAVVTATAHGFSDGDEVVLSGIVGMTELNSRRCIVANKTTNTFELTDQATGANIDSTGFTAYSSGGEADLIFEIATPYDKDDLALVKFSQSADVMTLVHPSYAPRELSRTAHDAWTLAEISFVPELADPTGLTGTQNGTTGSTEYKYKVTAIDDETGIESLPAVNNASATISGATQANPVVITANSHGFSDGDEIEIDNVSGMTELNGRRFRVANKTTNTFELQGEDGSGYSAYSSGGTARLTFVRVTNGNATLSATDNISLSWSSVTGAERYAVYKYDNGTYGQIGETETTSFTDDGSLSPDLDVGPPRFREPFFGTDNWPGAVGYYQQRRVFGGSNNRPDTSDYSRTADQSNFTASVPQRADDAFRATLTSLEVNQIRHYVPMNDLLLFTSGEEWRVDAGNEQAFGFDTIRQNPQSQWGVSHRRPLKIGRTVLFVEDNDSAVRSIGYELRTDGYEGTEMSLLAPHLFRDDVMTDWAYARLPDPLVVSVRADGIAPVMTFNEEQEVIAWARWATRTPDKFEAVAAIRPTATAIDDSAYFVVKRSIDGNTVRYIEKTHDRRFVDVQDCFFVDSGLTFDNPVDITGVSLADPVELTIDAGHGLEVDDEVDISDIIWVPDVDDVSNETQPDQLNGGRFKVKAKTATTVTLKTQAGTDVDATGFNAYVEGGHIRKAVTSLTGYHHLAGESVIALANGGVVRNLTVSATGGITLPDKASRVHVGLSYYSDVETLDIAVQGGDQAQGRLKAVYELLIRVDRTRGLWLGPDRDHLQERAFRREEAYGVPTQLFTGDIEEPIPSDWNRGGRVVLRQRDPLPLTVLAIVPRFDMENSPEE